MTESREAVSAFLQELQSVLRSEAFDYQRDLDILRSKKTDSDNAGYTTIETLEALGFNNKDVYEELLGLTERDYKETQIDDKDSRLPKFYAFGKTIESREVYIKVKVRDRERGKVFCVSFHFARYSIVKPYV